MWSVFQEKFWIYFLNRFFFLLFLEKFEILWENGVEWWATIPSGGVQEYKSVKAYEKGYLKQLFLSENLIYNNFYLIDDSNLYWGRSASRHPVSTTVEHIWSHFGAFRTIWYVWGRNRNVFCRLSIRNNLLNMTFKVIVVSEPYCRSDCCVFVNFLIGRGEKATNYSTK